MWLGPTHVNMQAGLVSDCALLELVSKVLLKVADNHTGNRFPMRLCFAPGLACRGAEEKVSSTGLPCICALLAYHPLSCAGAPTGRIQR